MAQGEQGRLALGFTSSAAAHADMPRTLRACPQQHPHIGLDLREANAAEITDAVQAEQLHCGFLRVPTSRPPGLLFETLFHEPALLALPIDHPLAHRPGAAVRPLALTALRDEAFILVRQPGAPGLYANLLALCETQGFSPRPLAWPAGPVRILPVYPPGGISDQVLRALAEQLAPLLGVQVQVDHRPGASTSAKGCSSRLQWAHRSGSTACPRCPPGPNWACPRPTWPRTSA